MHGPNLGSVRRRFYGCLIGERAKNIEVRSDHRHIGLLRRRRELEHLRLPLVTEVRCVGAGLL